MSFFTLRGAASHLLLAEASPLLLMIQYISSPYADATIDFDEGAS